MTCFGTSPLMVFVHHSWDGPFSWLGMMGLLRLQHSRPTTRSCLDRKALIDDRGHHVCLCPVFVLILAFLSFVFFLVRGKDGDFWRWPLPVQKKEKARALLCWTMSEAHRFRRWNSALPWESENCWRECLAQKVGRSQHHLTRKEW